MTHYTNKTGFEIEIISSNGEILLKNNEGVLLKNQISKNEIIVYVEDDIMVYSENNCKIFISDGYIDSCGVKVVEIYIG